MQNNFGNITDIIIMYYVIFLLYYLPIFSHVLILDTQIGGH